MRLNWTGLSSSDVIQYISVALRAVNGAVTTNSDKYIMESLQVFDGGGLDDCGSQSH